MKLSQGLNAMHIFICAHLRMDADTGGKAYIYIYVLAFLKLKACATASVPPGTEEKIRLAARVPIRLEDARLAS